ncbi:hypothetical protein RJT34_17753 [Clitoria ternatea]|uniref:Bifunctional inhibitor/plant lipid transfer protein/seed storage helical domain-containing protein n=1 Tax=Clitoria ternatea TaxID=43366 RepID=A0AAN9JB28_CLITE
MVMMKATCLTLMLLGTLYVAMAAALTCDDVKPTLEACKEYVRTGGETVPPSCCYSALGLRNLVMSSAADRQIACHCIQDAAKQMTLLNRTAYADVPKRCGLRLSFHFEINMNCNKYVPLQTYISASPKHVLIITSFIFIFTQHLLRKTYGKRSSKGY